MCSFLEERVPKKWNEIAEKRSKLLYAKSTYEKISILKFRHKFGYSFLQMLAFLSNEGNWRKVAVCASMCSLFQRTISYIMKRKCNEVCAVYLPASETMWTHTFAANRLFKCHLMNISRMIVLAKDGDVAKESTPCETCAKITQMLFASHKHLHICCTKVHTNTHLMGHIQCITLCWT